MGWDIYLTNNEESVEVPTQTHIGSLLVFAVDENHNEIHRAKMRAHLSITFNYRDEYARVFGDTSLNWLHGQVAKRTIKRLQKGVKLLGTHRGDNYWKSSPGNAGYWLRVMLHWARLHPDAIWKVYA